MHCGSPTVDSQHHPLSSIACVDRWHVLIRADQVFYYIHRFPPSAPCIGMDDPTVIEALTLTPPTLPTLSTQSPDNSTTPKVCPLPNNTFFSDSSKSFAIGWVSFWSVLCFISTTLTILTFLLDTSRFEYPWRPVVYLALAFNIHSVAYFFSLALGRRLVTCPDGQFVSSTSTWSWAHTPCILVFIFLYYTMMAAFIWWVILTVCWFLVSALQWSHEAVSKLAPFLQAVAWILPLLMTISLLAARVVGADDLTATCFVVSDGSRSSFLALLLGVVIPLVLFLVVGIIFLLLGFIGMLRIRSFMHQGGKQQEKQSLEKLMVRIGIFVTMYIVPASVLVGCFVYELASRPGWQPLSKPCSSCSRPNSAVFMVRIFMFLLIGTLTGVWIWSHKTLKSWQQFPAKCGTCCRDLRHEGESEDTPVPVSADNMMGKDTMMMPSYSYPDSGLDST